jgi:hypothetical protein
MPEFPIDPNDLLRRLDQLWSALNTPGQVGDRAGEIVAAINRLADEVAKLNENVQRALPVIESVDENLKRAMPMVDSFQQAGQGIQALRRSMRRPPPPGDTAGGPGGTGE